MSAHHRKTYRAIEPAPPPLPSDEELDALGIMPRTDVRANLVHFLRRPSETAIPILRGGYLWFWSDRHNEGVIEPETFGPATPLWMQMHLSADEAGQKDYCYFVGADEGAVKIGYSRDPQRRLADLQMCCPVKLSILALRDGGIAREAAYHVQFDRFRLHGEWFERSDEILAEIETPPPSHLLGLPVGKTGGVL